MYEIYRVKSQWVPKFIVKHYNMYNVRVHVYFIYEYIKSVVITVFVDFIYLCFYLVNLNAILE